MLACSCLPLLYVLHYIVASRTIFKLTRMPIPVALDDGNAGLHLWQRRSFGAKLEQRLL